MRRNTKRLEQLKIIVSLQEKAVARAAQEHVGKNGALQQATAKLENLRTYFEGGTDPQERATTPVALLEASVFASRLADAISQQQLVCEQLKVQCEASRQVLMKAEQRRVGLKKTRELVFKNLMAAKDRIELQVTEDSVAARYNRYNS